MAAKSIERYFCDLQIVQATWSVLFSLATGLFPLQESKRADETEQSARVECDSLSWWWAQTKKGDVPTPVMCFSVCMQYVCMYATSGKQISNDRPQSVVAGNVEFF